MKQEQFFNSVSPAIHAKGLRHLQKNLTNLLTHEHTETVYVTLSEATCTSSCRAHADLYESIAVQQDIYRPYLPDTFGFTHTHYQTTLVWYLTYFAIGNWQRLSVRAATQLSSGSFYPFGNYCAPWMGVDNRPARQGRAGRIFMFHQ